MRIRRAAVTLALAVASTAAGLVMAGPAHALPPCMNNPPPDWCFPDQDLNDPSGTFTTATQGPNGITVIGSATDPNGGPVSVDITVGGVHQGTVVANQPYNTFYATVPVTVAGSSVCATALNIGLGSNTSLGCKALTVRISPFGALDVASLGAGQAQVTGWAVDPNTASSISVNVITNGVTHGPYVANLYRPDIDSAAPGYGYNHGYNLSVPIVAMTELNSVCVVALNVGVGGNTSLGCASF